MKFALVDNNKLEATKGLKGTCPICGSELIAKCGTVKINHWAHKGTRNCDPWWENETEWHRIWKNNFSNEWQENILTDERTGEKHIADIRTIHGLVIEFQHSHIDPGERTKREDFYKNMVWVVDGTRLKRDYPRFLKGKEAVRLTNKQGIFLVDFPEECFPSACVGSLVPVIFDFKGIEKVSNPNDWRNHLYYLFPKTNARESLVAIISRESLINDIITGDFLKQKQEPEKKIEKPPLKSIQNIPQRQSQYVYDRGRYVKRKRF
jgi:competence protein CoiA